MIEVLKQAVVYFEHMVRTLQLRDESEPAQLLFKLRQAIVELESQNIKQVTVKDFVHMVEGREDLIGRPVYFAQWPNGNTHPPQRTEQEPVAFASIKIRVGNQQVEKLLTQIELHHAIDPWGLVEQAAEMCIEELKEMDT